MLNIANPTRRLRPSKTQGATQTVTVIIPAALLEYTRGNREITVEASTVGELLEKLESMFPGLKDRICNEQGALRRYVNVFVNEDGIDHENLHRAELRSNDTVHILPSIAGGR